MADASRVGYRTNGLSSALQLHHLSSRVGQTDGIALPGVHQRRMPMDHAIADSHATVTISHSGAQESRDPPIACNAEIPPIRGQKEPPPGSLSYFDTRRCVRGKARVSAIRHACRPLDTKARIGGLRPVMTSLWNFGASGLGQEWTVHHASACVESLFPQAPQVTSTAARLRRFNRFGPVLLTEDRFSSPSAGPVPPASARSAARRPPRP
jgi:hypothetical protein